MTEPHHTSSGIRNRSSALSDREYSHRFSAHNSENKRTTHQLLHDDLDILNSPPTKPNKVNSSHSELSISDSDNDGNPQGTGQKGAASSNNTSALLEDNLDDLDSLDVGSKAKENRREMWEREMEETDGFERENKRSLRDKGEDEEIYKENKYRDRHDDYRTENLSLGGSYEPTDLFNREISRDDLTLTRDFDVSKSKKRADETIGSVFSTKKPYRNDIRDDFTLESSLERSNQKDKQRWVESENLQLNRKNVDFGVLYPTETREEMLEIFNKGRTDLTVNLSIRSSRSTVKFCIISEEDEIKQTSASLIISKYTFKVVRIVAEMNTSGLESERDFRSILAIDTDRNKQLEVPLNCRMESPSLQILESNVAKMVGSVPFLDFDISKLGSDGELQIPFRNNGRRLLLLEFELIANVKLAEVVFSPKYLTLKEEEEKTISIKAIRSYDYENKKKAILKYRVKGTQLCQCIVINLV